jgi:hypothetical protein
MDGFQAVKAIKSNPATASIPIVMYTSTQGGVYFGQARALGAADVIAKPASPEDLSAVLQRLAQRQPEAVAAVESEPPEVVAAPAGYTPAPAPEPPPEPRAPMAMPEFTPRAADAPSRAVYWLVAALVAALIWSASAYYIGAKQRDRLLRQQQVAFQTIAWAVNLSQEYPYGEAPFSGARLRHLQELVGQLRTAGFRGTIRLESHVGEFCRLQLPAAKGRGATWIEAPAELALTDCSALGQSAAEAQQQSEGQSHAFRRYLEQLPEIAPDIHVEVVALGASEPTVDYPTDADVSAGVWNRVARRNQRVHVVLEPLAQPARAAR